MQNITHKNLSDNLLAWYDQHARELPWRIPPKPQNHNLIPNPYHIWMSEIMLQQTQVVTVKDYFLKFTNKWPSVADLAAADIEDVLSAWAGLGYYARARNLHKCAKQVMDEYAGQFPKTEVELLKLAGVGQYTAAAIAAIAFNEKANVVDGNVERVMARVEAFEGELPKAKKQLYEIAGTHLPNARFGDYAQSLMDLGATICTPKSPKCLICPITKNCQMANHQNVESYPKKTPKKAKAKKFADCFIVTRHNAKGQLEYFVQRRPDKGLLGGMYEFPMTHWEANKGDKSALDALYGTGVRVTSDVVTHIFTHIHLTVRVVQLSEQCFDELLQIEDFTNMLEPDRRQKKWVKLADIQYLALPTLMEKIFKLAD